MNSPADTLIREVARQLRAVSIDSSSEAVLQAALETILAPLGFVSERHTEAGRMDFHHPDASLCIEVKVAGTTNELRRQCLRYLQLPEVEQVLVITNQARLHGAAALEGVSVWSLSSRRLILGYSPVGAAA